MAFSNSQAQAVEQLIRFFLRIPGVYTHDIPSSSEALASALLLNGLACRNGSAGIPSSMIADAWPMDPPSSAPSAPSCSNLNALDTKAAEEAEIQSCPFCGKPGAEWTRTIGGVTWYYIGCSDPDCPGLPLAGFHDRPVALDRWNKRHSTHTEPTEVTEK